MNYYKDTTIVKTLTTAFLPFFAFFPRAIFGENNHKKEDEIPKLSGIIEKNTRLTRRGI